MGAAMRYQPQGRILLNRSNPLTRGLIAAYIPRSGPRDATGTLTTLVDVVPVTSPFGYITPPLNTGGCPVVGPFQITRTDSFSAFVLGRFAGSNDSNIAPTISATSPSQFGIGWKFGPAGTGGNLGLTILSVADYSTSVPFPAAGSIAFSAIPGSNVRIFTGGGFRQQVAVGSISANMPAARLGLGQRTDGPDSTSASQVALALYWNRALTDAEQTSLAANPWQIFDAGSSSSAYQAAIASAGISSTGARSFAYSALGGAVFGGTAARVRGISRAPAGSLTIAGSGQAVRGMARATQGGALLSGAAQTSFHASVQSRVVSAAGGLLIRGAAVLVRAWRRLASGRISWGGTSTAVETASTPPAVASFCLSTLMRANAVCAQATISNAAINRTANLL